MKRRNFLKTTSYGLGSVALLDLISTKGFANETTGMCLLSSHQSVELVYAWLLKLWHAEGLSQTKLDELRGLLEAFAASDGGTVDTASEELAQFIAQYLPTVWHSDGLTVIVVQDYLKKIWRCGMAEKANGTGSTAPPPGGSPTPPPIECP